MSRVSYFQRFSQKENHATNNALLLLRHFYQASPLKVERALTSLLDAQLSIGLNFEQQVRTEHSVPDALISQSALHIFIETKRGEVLDHNQIERHLSGIIAKDLPGTVFLIGLTKSSIDETAKAEFAKLTRSKNVIFGASTFTGISDALRSQCALYEADLLAVLDDFDSYLEDANLTDDRNRWLPILPCGISLAENIKFGLYYEPPARRLKKADFLGIYANKAVRYIGRVEAVLICSWSGWEPTIEREVGEIPLGTVSKIKQMVEETPYYDLRNETERFYVTDGFVPTDIKKTTPGGIRGPQYLDLPQIVGTSFNARATYAVDDLAALLSGTTFA